MKQRILIIDDNECQAIAACFSSGTYVLDCLNAGVPALERLRSLRYDCVLIGRTRDLFPADLLELMRQSGLTMPILFLSEKTSPSYKEFVFDRGADEYVTSPFDAIEVGARVRALLRRSTRYLGDVLTAYDLAVNTSSLRVFRGAAEVHLAPMEFNLLVFLMRNADRVYTSEDLAAHVWPDRSQPTVEAIRTCVKSLRRKTGTGSSLIRTAYGSGYYLDSKNSDFAPQAVSKQAAVEVRSSSSQPVLPVSEAVAVM